MRRRCRCRQGTEALLQEGVGGRGRGVEGRGLAAVGNGSANGTGDDYPEIVMRWIARFEQYPPEALAQKQEGTVVVGFRFQRDGTILDAWVEKSWASRCSTKKR